MTRKWLGNTQIIHRIGLGLSLALTLSMLALTWLAPSYLARLENAFLDLRFRLRGEQPANPDVVIVVVDEKSLRDVGRWPWSRSIQARLLEALSKDGAKVIGNHVNLAARVEGLTRQLQVPIVNAEYAAARLRPYLSPSEGKPMLGHLEYRKSGAVKVKGRPLPVVVYGMRPVAEGESVTFLEEATLTETLEMKEK